MYKKELRAEIQRYIDFGYSIQSACQQVNNLYHSKHLEKIIEIQNQMITEAA